MKYAHNLAIKVGKAISKMWKTEVLFSDSSRISTMVNVRLPTTDPEIIKILSKTLVFEFKTYIPTFNMGRLGGNPKEFYTRFSCTPYNELSDYIYAGKAVL